MSARLLLLVALAGCGAVTSDGQGRVAVGDCDVIVGDELGRMPPRHGGPDARGKNGTGVDCRVWRF